ncbi:MAG: hypothetical protein JWR55_3028 [Aeromicrobium sp.]|jgi:hypothetical protein|nr:hypothetical protein [Aeromicrobium sp.]
MYTDFTAQSDIQQQERELTARLERRRIAAERATAQLPGGRLELIARLARQARATRPGAGRPTPAAG